PQLTKRLLAVWKKTLGNENVEIVDATMGGEDFSEYSLPDHSIPAVDFHIGAVDPVKIADSKKNGTLLPSLHSSKFAPVPEPTIRIGMIGMTSAVLALMKKYLVIPSGATNLSQDDGSRFLQRAIPASSARSFASLTQPTATLAGPSAPTDS